METQHCNRVCEKGAGAGGLGASARAHAQPLAAIFQRRAAADADRKRKAAALTPARAPEQRALAPIDRRALAPQFSSLPPLSPPAEETRENMAAQLRAARADISRLKSVDLPGRVAEAVLNVQRAATQHEAREELKAKSIETLVGELHPHFALSPSGTEVRCGVCPGYDRRRGLTEPGVFNVNQPFSQLKRSLGDHILSERHRNALDALDTDRTQASVRLRAGLNVARAVYLRIKQGGSYLGFEDELVLLDECGSDVGTLNHSRMFAAAFVDSLYSALRERVKKLLNSPHAALGDLMPPFAVNADKATCLRHTNQIVGLLMFMNGEIKALFGSSVIQREESLCDQLVAMVTEVATGGSLKSRWAGAAFDGHFGQQVRAAP